MKATSIDVLVKIAYLAQQNGIIQLKDARIVLDAVEDAEAELMKLSAVPDIKVDNTNEN
jgi:hypothetical protein